ncbi:MAG: phosphoribosylformylglycinamidine cyclo-ligase [Candidatus Marinimicrobia bacterium]|nr:phosphoribosylformylglycinamidine cyclo-ligase [Candidatus Neomarinimicrobiota bacterium]MBT3634421.1 phosphoribosylformylglycinamidine cyclo-ligase [Candidatus Neomarinimicrobiota bacterium]MBT3683248.1 phosphoribosylformylglycinamidine cyclo-ligase [Candidatus Neomarinimicrobiota bacterium]MBT3760136.1 phosphoribosylformylglycinamidine cyclo-ligase [Candidatus Neomarinimicrobiota bacterium]MBT3896231.1 phosphoribosylformylglycinamidine cyclo-ligase [Candidatus Neomarinimicrobiota bacterium
MSLISCTPVERTKLRATYKDSGVDIEAGNRSVEIIKKKVKSTFTPNVLTNIGSFGGCFEFPKDEYDNPVLVSSADGVGTKLKIAFKSNRHNTIGQCLVNHCVNDILTTGAEPLFFLDYFATSKLNNDVLSEVITGLATACRENNCALIGGETAEMPGFYGFNEYDMSGTIVGVVDKNNMMSNRAINTGDILIGLPSTGLHTNGYSLARNVLLNRFDLDDYIDELDCLLYEELLKIHRSYLPVVRDILKKEWLTGISHITGGGIEGNTNRILDDNSKLDITWNAWDTPPIFSLIQKLGNVPLDDMREATNMGIGLILIIKSEGLSELTEFLNKNNEKFVEMGKII